MPQTSPYDPLEVSHPFEEWRITGHPHAGTVSLDRGPRYVGSETDEDTEPLELFGVPYRISALAVVRPDGTATIDRAFGSRTGSFSASDLTPAARRRLHEILEEILQTILEENPKLPAQLEDGKREADRRRLEETRARVRRILRHVDAQLEALESGEPYQSYPNLEEIR